MEEGSSSSDGSKEPVTFSFMTEYSRLPCNQCLFFASAFGCKRGDACAFCHHVIPEKLPSARPRKARRDALKAQIWGLLQQLDVEKQEPQEVVYQLQSASRQCEYSRVISQNAVDSLLQQVEMKHRAQGHPVPPRGETCNESCGALHRFSV
ncbi:unnamed protein product [Cladocopium goreaui]|uniref:C3H1-type domain-containing protein n=1 Tax=Cladocopium goreaui TaxID=2562237 RepID=A0A9P1GDF5_9DINO|nr:unnamed protein product [Cladocopium goreaui]